MGRVAKRRSLAVAVAAVVLLAATPTTAMAWHQWSYARETDGDPLFGARSTRLDVNVTCIGNNAVYEPLWVIANYDNWVEVGTGHCSWSDHFWYSGYEANKIWQWVNRIPISSLSNHQMQLFRQAPCDWEWKIDVTVMNSSVVSWCFGGPRIEAGLESYGTYHGVPAFNTSSLQVFGSNPSPAWRSWSGKDYHHVTSTILCGHWVSSTNWRAGENTTC